MKGLGVGLAATLALLILAAAAERICERIDAGRFPPQGLWVRVDRRQLHVQCAGRGQPLIMLEAGLGDDSTVWDKVYPKLSKLGRVCRYDRAGLGWSPGTGATHTPGEAVTDLEAVLNAVHGAGRTIIVAHSYGGMLVRLYAARHPGAVGGIVLLDAAHEDQFQPPYSLPNETAGWGTDPTPLLASFGILRLEDAFDSHAERDGPVERALRLRAERYWTRRATSRSLPDVEAAVRSNPNLGDIPLAVVTATSKPAKYRAIWLALQSRLAKLSSCSLHLYSDKSRHYLQKDDPRIVLQAVRWVLSAQTCDGRLTIGNTVE